MPVLCIPTWLPTLAIEPYEGDGWAYSECCFNSVYAFNDRAYAIKGSAEKCVFLGIREYTMIKNYVFESKSTMVLITCSRIFVVNNKGSARRFNHNGTLASLEQCRSFFPAA